MKKIICLLICINVLFILNGCSGWGKSLPRKSSPKEIAYVYWYVEGGKIKAVNGSWWFGKKYKGINRKTGKYAPYYKCSCKFTVVNDSSKTYRIEPVIKLYDHEYSQIYEVKRLIGRLSPRMVKPREKYEFTGSFGVPKEIAFQSFELDVTLKYTEVGKK